MRVAELFLENEEKENFVLKVRVGESEARGGGDGPKSSS